MQNENIVCSRYINIALRKIQIARLIITTFMESFIEQQDYPREVFFLGAGASALAGVPTFADFYDKAKIIYQTKKNEIDEVLFRRVLEYWNKDFKQCNIEEFYSAVEMRELLHNTISTEEKEKSVTTDEIENFIYPTIKKSIHDINPDIYGLFLAKSTTKSVIITTNWDILLETSWQYHIENGYITYESVQPHSTVIPTDGTNREKFRKEKFRILKLHGSLNWGFCKECGNIYYFNEKVDEMLAKNELLCDTCEKGKLARIIVPPKLSKLIKPEGAEYNSLNSAYHKLSQIWSNASKYLEMCERIYFIGYSFPETDVQMRTFISNALRNSKPKEIKIVSNKKHGNSQIAFEEKYLSILSKFVSHSKIDFYYEGFKKYCNELDDYGNRNTRSSAQA
jgi:NAD-dependent SIR2 family protein deacetylase